MYERLMLRKNGLVEYEYDVAGEDEEYKAGYKPLRDVTPFFDYTVILEDGFTLRSYFEMVRRYSLQDFSVYFVDYMNEYDRSKGEKPDEDFRQDKEHDNKGYGKPCDIDVLYFRKRVDIDTWEDDGTITGEDIVDFDGECRCGMGQAIDFIKLKNLLDIPFALRTMRVYHGKGPMESLYEVEAKYNYKFFEFFYSVINELSWHGRPKDRDAKGEKLKGSLKEISKEIEEKGLSNIGVELGDKKD